MSDRIVSLTGAPVVDARQPRADVIGRLEELLELARAGEIQAMGYALLHGDRLTSWNAVGVLDATHSLVGACYQLANHVSAEAAKR